MSKYKFSVGDSYPEREISTAGIHVDEGGSKHGNRIEVYGSSLESAEALRDYVLEANARADKLEAENAELEQRIAAFRTSDFAWKRFVDRLKEDNAKDKAGLLEHLKALTRVEVDRLEMVPDPMGDYVLHSDYEALQQENAELKKTNLKLMDERKSVVENGMEVAALLGKQIENLKDALRTIRIQDESYDTEDEVLGFIFLTAEKALAAIPPVDREEG